MAVTKNQIEKALVQVRRIEAHRAAGSEKEIRRIYKELLKDLKQFIGYEYANLSKDGKLTYEILQQKGEFARFLEEATAVVNKNSPKISQEIMQLVEDTYEHSYKGMVSAVSKSKDVVELKDNLTGLSAVTPETIKRAVENPIAGLTLKDTLEKNRREIVYNIKRNIGVGLAQGDLVSTMANRITQSLDGDYKKAIRIVRTETHRVREGGFFDAATDIDNVLINGVSGRRMVKTWKTMKDARVRNTAEANHVSMEGEWVLANEKFELNSGDETDCPGNSGNPAHDINCRCYVSYDLKEIKPMVDEKFNADKYNYIADDEISFDKLSAKMNVTEAERIAIEGIGGRTGYTGSYMSQDINNVLRSGQSLNTLSEQAREVHDSLISAISKNTLPKDAILDRYTTNKYMEDVFGEKNFIFEFGSYANDRAGVDKYVSEFLEKNLGTEITEKSFVSTSAVSNLNVFEQYPVRLKLYTKEGTHAYITGNKYESEIILPPDTKYIIRGANAKGKMVDNEYREDLVDEFGDMLDKIEVYTLELICEVVKK